MNYSSNTTLNRSVMAFCLVLFLSEFGLSVNSSVIPFKRKDTAKILREIYREMKEFDNYPGYDFVKREFFVGEDDDDTNKDIHVVILVQDVDDKEKVTIQVTYMERSKGKPVVGIAKYIKILSFYIQENQAEIIKSDFDERGKEIVLPGVLQAIKNKKKLLKEI